MSGIAIARRIVLTFIFVAGLLYGHAYAAVDTGRTSVELSHASPSRTSGDRPSEPFGLATSLLPAGELRSKWLKVEHTIEVEMQVIDGCRDAPASCTSPAARQFLDILKTGASYGGITRLGRINRAFNLAIRAASDLEQYGEEDHWSSPLETLATGAGDCEDYAIAKLVALRQIGFTDDDLRLVIIREVATGEDHAVLAVRFEERWRLLDNRTMVMIEDNDLSKYQPVFAIDVEGVKRFEQPSAVTAGMARDTQPSSTATQLASTGFRSIATLAVEPISEVFTIDNLRPALTM